MRASCQGRPSRSRSLLRLAGADAPCGRFRAGARRRAPIPTCGSAAAPAAISERRSSWKHGGPLDRKDVPKAAGSFGVLYLASAMARLHLGGDDRGRAAPACPGHFTADGEGRVSEAVADRNIAVFRVLDVDGYGDECLLEDDGDGAVEVDDRAARGATEAGFGRYAPSEALPRKEGPECDGIYAGASGTTARTAVGVRVRGMAVLRRAASAHKRLSSSVPFGPPWSCRGRWRRWPRSFPDPARPSRKREDEECRDCNGPEDDPIETIGPAGHCGLAGRAGCAGSG